MPLLFYCVCSAVLSFCVQHYIQSNESRELRKSTTGFLIAPAVLRNRGVLCCYFMYLYRKVTIWPLVQGSFGLNMSAPVPLVICGSWFTAHSTASV